MKKMLYAVAIACLSVSSVSAQQSTSENPPTIAQTTFFAELGGPGVLFSANIDRRFKKSNLGWGGRVGLGFVSGSYYDWDNDTYDQMSIVTIPVQVNYVFGKGESPHTFEVGAGATFLGKRIDVFNNYLDSGGSNVMGTAAFMYRRQPKNGGFTWRIGFTPFIYDGYIQASGGVSVGYAF